MAAVNTIPPAPAETSFTDARGRITVPWRAWLNTLVSLGATVASISTDYLQRALNLSDLTNVVAARTNLGLGSAATHNFADFDPAGAASAAQAAAIAASDPVGSAAAVLASSLQKASNLADVASASTARTNLGLGTAATQASSAFDASGAASAAQTAAIAASLQRASNLSDLASASTARTNLGLGTAALNNTGDFDASGAASAAQTAAIAASLQRASNLSDLASASTARTNLGLGTAATQASSAFDAAGTAAALLGTNNTWTGTNGFGGQSPRQQMSVGAFLDLYSGAANSPTQPSVRASSGGNLILSAISAGGVFLAYDGGTSGVRFGNGASAVVATVDAAGKATFSGLVLSTGGAPATSGSTGTAGTLAWDTGFLYVCTATNTWKRVALATF